MMGKTAEAPSGAIAIPDTDTERAELVMLQTLTAEITVSDEAEFQQVADRLADVKTFRKAIEAKFRPGISAADKLHKWLIALWRTEFDTPAGQMESRLTNALTTYRRQVEAEASRLLTEAAARGRRQAEEERIAEATRAANEGDADEAARVLETPIVVPIQPAPPPAPKAAGIAFTKTYHAEIVDRGKVPPEWWEINMKALDAHARATRGQATVAGVKFVCIEGTRSKGR